ncbi:hypothetical protein [Engelhardtia mirabilis]|uniref:DUF4345 domain-containing protein n=1 Tax=Engelhardtia mirabilis TaxID=2528011 RepID=A0A518BEH0_9BACT|nr:hypothetical protein Pla133_04520 [Planctomycetes bacterium Pla133]QDU99713.1 hypothetical protein Pla86_04520 [Planctomycetes bacterium Pla86]
MIDPDHSTTSWFLWIVGVAFLLGSAVPLFLVPLKWGRAFGWRLPTEQAFTVYLGRCLGGVALVLSAATFRAAPDPESHLESLEILLGSAAALLLVHVWGALRREQPWQENVELLMYATIVGYGGYLYAGLPGALL